MAEKAIMRTKDTTILRPPCGIDNTGPDWPVSLLVPVLNQANRPSAAAVSEGLTLQHAPSSPHATSMGGAEVIGRKFRA
jgi:hypothetical protein